MDPLAHCKNFPPSLPPSPSFKPALTLSTGQSCSAITEVAPKVCVAVGPNGGLQTAPKGLLLLLALGVGLLMLW